MTNRDYSVIIPRKDEVKIMSMLLDNDILARLTQTNVVTGLVLLVLGIVLALCSSKIAKLIRKKDKVEPNDRVFLTLKAFALALILVSLIVMIIE